jgi:uncharacterized protein (TIGR03435 family)
MALVTLAMLGLASAKIDAQPQDSRATNFAPAFEVASIRPNEPGRFAPFVRTSFEPGGYSASHTTLLLLIKDAYGIDFNQIVGAPKWSTFERYEIEARMDDATIGQLSKLNEDERKLAHQRMLQALLAERFKLAVHHATKTSSVYSLVISKNGPKLHEARLGEPSGGVGVDYLDGRMISHAAPMGGLVERLEAELGRPVVDQTGLTGRYDFTLQVAPWELRALADGEGWIDNVPPSVSAGASLMTALQEQLGLKLKSQKAPIEVLVIDHVETPSEN